MHSICFWVAYNVFTPIKENMSEHMSYTWDQEIIHKGGNPNLLANYTAQEICRTEPILTLAMNPENTIHENKDINSSIHLQILALFISTPHPKGWKGSTSAWLDAELVNWVGIGQNRKSNSHRLRNFNLIWGFFDPSICWAPGLVIVREDEEEKDKQAIWLGRVSEKDIPE